MDNETPELIEQRMQGTRQSLADKIAALETQVTHTLHSTTQQVQDTVQSIVGAVEDTVGSVTGGVKSLRGVVDDAVGSVTHGGIQSAMSSAGDGLKDAFDVRPYVRDNPWQAVGGAAVAGLLTGFVFGPSQPRATSGGGYPAYQPAAASSGSNMFGLFDGLFKMLGDEVRKVGEQAIQSMSKSVNQTVSAGVPKLVDTAVSRLSDAMPDVSGHADQPVPGKPQGYRPV